VIAKNDAVKSGSEDGLSLMVYVNNALTGNLITVPTSGALVDFSRDLGQLKVGDSIYVVINAMSNQDYDGFKAFDFSIQKLMPVAQAFAALMAVPEPASLVQMGVVMVLMAMRRRVARSQPVVRILTIDSSDA
jgi:hypothetical protein